MANNMMVNNKKGYLVARLIIQNTGGKRSKGSSTSAYSVCGVFTKRYQHLGLHGKTDKESPGTVLVYYEPKQELNIQQVLEKFREQEKTHYALTIEPFSQQDYVLELQKKIVALKGQLISEARENVSLSKQIETLEKQTEHLIKEALDVDEVLEQNLALEERVDGLISERNGLNERIIAFEQQLIAFEQQLDTSSLYARICAIPKRILSVLRKKTYDRKH